VIYVFRGSDKALHITIFDDAKRFESRGFATCKFLVASAARAFDNELLKKSFSHSSAALMFHETSPARQKC